MKTTFNLFALSALAFGLLLSSCGTGKKLLVSEARVNQLQKDSISVNNNLKMCQADVLRLNEEKALIEKDLNLLSSESKMTIAEQAVRLKSLQDVIQSQKDVMTGLKNTISEALVNYAADELSVYIKDGNVYVSLAEKLLFKSGSDVVNPKGKEALKSLAEVINNTKDISVMIEGHTDNVPIKTKVFPDNWSLSTARAASIVRILTLDYAFDARRITASGRSEFHPVQPNTTDAGRAVNRRTEIILTPDLKELFRILEQ
ncbi:MAG: chemotaxis protein [Bacteroidetes bacterium]|nr:MAG: chemotaxis protein [Bacteroidota bacterium]